MLIFFNYASIFLAGSFGILALLVDYKDKSTGRITPWGRFALLGVVVSTVVAAITFTLDSREERASAISELKRQAELFASQSRILNNQIEIMDGVLSAAAPLDLEEVIMRFDVENFVKGRSFPNDQTQNLNIDVFMCSKDLPAETNFSNFSGKVAESCEAFITAKFIADSEVGRISKGGIAFTVHPDDIEVDRPFTDSVFFYTGGAAYVLMYVDRGGGTKSPVVGDIARMVKFLHLKIGKLYFDFEAASFRTFEAAGITALRIDLESLAPRN